MRQENLKQTKREFPSSVKFSKYLSFGTNILISSLFILRQLSDQKTASFYVATTDFPGPDLIQNRVASVPEWISAQSGSAKKKA